MAKFPNSIYVRWEGEEDSRYLDASENADGAENGQEVARYELVEVKTKRITHELK